MRAYVAKIQKVLIRWRKILMVYTWWELTLFVVGAVSLVTLLAVLFFPVGKGPSTFTIAGDAPAASSPQFVGTLSDVLNLPQRQGNAIQIENNGDEFLHSLLADIDGAHSSIHIMVYIWTDGDMSRQVLAHAEQKLKEGVQVRIMVDAYGSKTSELTKVFKTFKELGGKVEFFHSLTLAPWDLLKTHARNHRRSIIIDGVIGYTGGMTVSDPWLGNARNPKEFRDTMFRTTGPMVRDLQGVFSELWTSTTGELLVGDVFYPPEKSDPAPKTLTYIPLASIPSPDSLVLQKFFLLSLYGAQHSIHITTPYFIPDPSLKEVLIAKAKAGIDVEVLVPNDHNDIVSARYASQYSYQDLLEAGVKIYEYQPTFIHSKALIVDGIWSVIGSANMDNRSRKINAEDIFGIKDGLFAAELETIFQGDITKAKQVDLAQWKQRSIWQRMREIFDQKFVQQY